MAHVDDLKQSRFISRVDCRELPWFTITGRGTTEVKQQDGSMKTEVVLYFHENPKPFILKFTNGQEIARLTGIMDDEHWQGVKIQLWIDPKVDIGGKLVGGIRVKQATNPHGRPAPQPAAPPSTFESSPQYDSAPPREPGQDEDPFDEAMRK